MIRFHTSFLVQEASGLIFTRPNLLVPANHRRVGPAGALIAANAAGPSIEILRHAMQDRNLAITAALVGVGLVKRAVVKGFILLDREFRPLEIDDDAVFLGDPVAEFERLRKLIARVQVEDVDSGLDLRQHGDNQAALPAPDR